MSVGEWWSLVRLLLDLGVAALRFAFTCGTATTVMFVVSVLRAFGIGLLWSLGDLRLPEAGLDGSFSLLSPASALGGTVGVTLRVISGGTSQVALGTVVSVEVVADLALSVGAFVAGRLGASFGSGALGLVVDLVEGIIFAGGLTGCLGAIIVCGSSSSSSSEEKSS